MKPLNVKIGDKVYFNDNAGIVIDITERGNALIWFDEEQKIDDITIRLEDRAVLDNKGNYIPNYNIRSEKEYIEYKKECDKKDVKVDIWNELYDIFHEHPIEATFEDVKKIVQKYKTYFE